MLKAMQIGLFFIAVLPVWGNIVWSLPATTIFSSGSATLQSAKLALHPTNHKALVTWVSQTSSNYIVEASFYNGASWSARNTFSGTSVGRLPVLGLVMDSLGNGVAIWDLFDGANLSIQAALFGSVSSTWGPAGPLQALGTSSYDSFPNLAINDAGYAIAAWRTSSNQLQAKTYNPFSSQWSSSYFINQSTLPLAASYSFPVAIDASNLLTSFFISSASDPQTLLYANFDALNPPSTPTNTPILPLAFTALSPQLSMDSKSGKVLFTIQASARMKKPLISGVNYLGTDPWELAVIDRPGDTVTVVSMAIDINPNGHAVAAWQLSSGEIQATVFNGVWSTTPAILSLSGASPAVAINQANNHALVVWEDLSGGSTNTIQSIEHDGTSWASAIVISGTSAVVGPPQIAIDKNGFAIAVWNRQVGMGTQIEAVTSQ